MPRAEQPSDMSGEDTAATGCSSRTIELDDTPIQAMKSALRKRLKQFTPVSGTKAKRPRISRQIIYKSPLTHLRKTKVRNIRSTSLDDSVVVLDELNISPAKVNRRVCASEREQPGSPDDSVIILSDNEGESRTAANVGTRSTPKRLSSKSSQVSPSKMSPETNATELQPISIDSEDENTIPNDDDTSASNSYAEIIIVDNSPGIGTDRDISPLSISKPGIGNKAKKVKASPRGTELSNRPIRKGADFSPEGIQAAAEQLISLGGMNKGSSLKGPLFLIDTQGDPSNLDRAKGEGKTKPRKRGKKHKSLQNPNWAGFVKEKRLEGSLETESTNLPEADEDGSSRTKGKDTSNTSSLPKESAPPTEQPGDNPIGSYYTAKAVDKAPGSLREIVIDGCNVAMAYTNGRHFSEEGLKLVINYFQLRGHTVKVFVPQHQRSMGRKFLEQLYTEGIAAFTPSRKIGGKKIVSYDDRFILDYATLCGGIVVSMDQYRDLYREKQQWRDIIENRLLVPTFVGNCVMFPEDPLGKFGPTLERFLRH